MQRPHDLELTDTHDHGLTRAGAPRSADTSSVFRPNRTPGPGRLPRVFRYICAAYWNRGTTVCNNGRMATMETAAAAIR